MFPIRRHYRITRYRRTVRKARDYILGKRLDIAIGASIWRMASTNRFDGNARFSFERVHGIRSRSHRPHRKILIVCRSSKHISEILHVGRVPSVKILVEIGILGERTEIRHRRRVPSRNVNTESLRAFEKACQRAGYSPVVETRQRRKSSLGIREHAGNVFALHVPRRQVDVRRETLHSGKQVAQIVDARHVPLSRIAKVFITRPWTGQFVFL